MPLRSQRAEILTGLFVIAGLFVLGWMTLQFGELGERPGESYPLSVVVRDAGGVREGVPVRFGGVDIGEVASDPELSEDFAGVEIELAIEEGQRIPSGSIVTVGTNGLMGDSFIRIDPPEKIGGDYLERGERLQGKATASLNDLAANAGETFEQIGTAVEEMRLSLARVDSVFGKLEETVIDPENTDNLRVLLAELRQSSELIHAAAKKIDPVLEETGSAMQEIREAAGSANETFVILGDGMGEFTDTLESIDPVVAEFDTTLDSLRSTLAETNRLLDEIEHGDGLASALIRDAGLREDVEEFADKLESNGVLFYPREGGLFRSRKEKESTKDETTATEKKRKAPSSFLKNKIP